MFDSGSQANLISEALVKKLGLKTRPHVSPYPLGWIRNKDKLQVTKQCWDRFCISSKLVDEIELDVVPLDICGIILRSPYLYDRKAVFFRHENKYHLMKDGVEYIVISHHMKVSAILVSAGNIKGLVDSSKGCMLMVLRVKEAKTVDIFKGCDLDHKK